MAFSDQPGSWSGLLVLAILCSIMLRQEWGWDIGIRNRYLQHLSQVSKTIRKAFQHTGSKHTPFCIPALTHLNSSESTAQSVQDGERDRWTIKWNHSAPGVLSGPVAFWLLFELTSTVFCWVTRAIQLIPQLCFSEGETRSTKTGFLPKERVEVLTEEVQPERDFHLKRVFCPPSPSKNTL